MWMRCSWWLTFCVLLSLLIFGSGWVRAEKRLYNIWEEEPECLKKGLCDPPTEYDGYSNYEERTLIFLINLARLDPLLYQKMFNRPEFVCLVDKELGIKLMTWNVEVSAAAKYHSKKMVEHDCYQLDTCGDCSPFASCKASDRLAKFYSASKTSQIIGRGAVEDVLDYWLSNEESCRVILHPSMNEIGVGVAKGRDDAFWTAAVGQSNRLNRGLVVGTHRMVGENMVFSVLFHDQKPDETLKDAFVYVDGEPVLTKRASGYTYNTKKKGKTALHEASVSIAKLEEWSHLKRFGQSQCHYYYFLFTHANTNTMMKLPASGYFYLTGYNGCQEVYNKEESKRQKPLIFHHDAPDEESKLELEARKQRILEKSREKREEKFKRAEQKRQEKGYDYTYETYVTQTQKGSSFWWVVLFVLATGLAIFFYRNRSSARLPISVKQS